MHLFQPTNPLHILFASPACVATQRIKCAKALNQKLLIIAQAKGSSKATNFTCLNDHYLSLCDFSFRLTAQLILLQHQATVTLARLFSLQTGGGQALHFGFHEFHFSLS